MPSHAEFMAAILARPHEDAPRLIYADWLEEQGETERAEFIRVQCELENLPEPQADTPKEVDVAWARFDQQQRDLQRREAFLTYKLSDQLIVPFTEYHGLLVGPNNIQVCLKSAISGRIDLQFRRGFVAEVHCTLDDWCGPPCPHCAGTGNWLDDRGFAMPCGTCRGKKRLPGHGPAIVAAQPVQEVRFADLETEGVGLAPPYRVGVLADRLPKFLRERMPYCEWQDPSGLIYFAFDFDGELRRVVSDVALLWAREAGLKVSPEERRRRMELCRTVVTPPGGPGSPGPGRG